MARTTPEQKQQYVIDAISAAGGSLTHDELVAALDQQGRGDSALELRNLKAAGRIVATLKPTPENPAKPVLRYALPEV